MQRLLGRFGRLSCLGKSAVLLALLVLIPCVIALPFALLQVAGESVGLLPTRTPAPTRTTAPTGTPAPTATPRPSETPRPTPTERPTSTPRPPTPTIDPTRVAGVQATRQAIASVGAAPCAVGQIKANRNSGIFHAPGQRQYEITQENVQCFDTESEARAAGYRKAER